MKNFFLVLLIILPFFGVAQTLNVRCDGSVSNLDMGKKEAGVTVSIVQGGQVISSATTASNGKYSVKGKIDHAKPFDIVFSKSGMVTKKVNFDFKSINLEDTPAGDLMLGNPLDLELFANRPGVDFSFLDTQPIAKLSWGNNQIQNDANIQKSMADKINKLLKDSEQNAKNNELAYQQAIAAADKAYNEKKYQEAMNQYEKALGIPGKGTEIHPTNRIIEIEDILHKQKEGDLANKQANEKYFSLIAEADKLFKAGDYAKAKDKYYEASDAKDDEQYPVDQIKEIAKRVKEQANEEKYKQLMASAEVLVKQKSYRAARDNYLEAEKLKPSEQLPKTKLKEIEGFIKGEEDAAAAKQKYEALVAEGEKLVKEEKWEEAKTKFQEALAIERASTYVKGQIDIIDKKLAEIKAEKDKLEKIALLIKEGDQAKVDKNYDAALAKYKEVLTLDKENAAVPPKITEVEGLKSQDAEAKAKEEKFNALVKQGDDAVTAKKFQDAVAKYTEALGLKDEAAVKIKKDAAEKALADLENAQQLEAKFAELVAAGQTAQTAKDYATALAKYTEALGIKENDAPTIKKVDEVKKLLADQQSAADKLAKIEKLIADGISLMEGNVMDGPQLELAKVKFNEVLGLDDKNATAKERLAQIEKMLADQKSLADKEAKFKDNVAKGDAEVANQAWEKAMSFYTVALGIKDDAGVQEKKAQAQAKLNELAEAKKLEEDYQKAITAANGLRDSKKYNEAIAKYTEAKGLKPSETIPQEEIDKINLILANDKAAADKKAQIDGLLAQGESLFGKKEFQNARATFVQVQGIDPENATAKKRIADIDAELTKLEGEAAKQQKIAGLIQEGEGLFASADYDGSEAKFKEVQDLDKTNAVAIKYLADIATKRAELKSQADAKQKFDAFVAQGDAAVSGEKWQEAVTAYTEALKLQQDATVDQKKQAVQQKLNALSDAKELDAKYDVAIKAANAFRDGNKYEDAISKYKEAQALKPNETLPQQEIDKINQIIAVNQSAEQQKQKIDQLLAEGQTLLNSKDFSNARSKYQEVLGLENTNATAIAKLAEITKEENAFASQQQNEAQFQQFKTAGIQAFGNKDYDNALASFQNALKFKEKDAEINGYLDQIAAIKSSQNQQKAEIDALLAKGKAAFDQKQWESAKNLYNDVLNKDNGNALAKSQLALIESELAKEQNAAKNLEEFNRLKAQGFAEAQSQEWEKAKHSLEQADAMKSDNEVKQKLNEVKQKIADKKNAEKLEQEYAAVISKAQLAEASKDYATAIAHYTQADGLKPSEQVKTKIAELKKQLEGQNALSAVDKKYNDLLAEGDEMVDKEQYAAAIQKYNEALSVKPTEQLPVIKAKNAERLADEQIKKEKDVVFEKNITAINNKIEENDFKKAREYIESATKLRPNDPRPGVLLAKIESIEKENVAYAEFMEKAAKEEGNKNYQQAINLYEKAKTVKPSKSEPTAKIDQLRQLLADATNASEKEKMYELYFNAGVEKQTAKEYDLALKNYKNALNIKPNDPKTTAKIDEVTKILEKQLAEKLAKQDSEAAFNQLITEADGYFNGKDYSKAIETYRSALSKKPESSYAKKQIDEANRLIKIDADKKKNADYQQILQVADGHFKTQRYQQALEFYNKALAIRKNDSYPKRKIDEINGILNPITESSEELKPLGEPFDGSALDGEMALKNAEAQRKDAKRRKIQMAQEKAIVANIELNQNKRNEMEATIGNIYDIYSTLVQNGMIAQTDKVAIASKVHRSRIEIEDLDVANKKYKRHSIDYTQNYLKDQTEQVDIEGQVAVENRVANNLKLDEIRIKEENAKTEKIQTNYTESILAKDELTLITKKIDEKNVESTIDKVAVAKDVNATRVYAEDKNEVRSGEKYDEAIAHKTKVEDINKAVEERGQVNTEQLIANNKEIAKIDIAAEEKQIALSKQNYHEAIGVESEMKGYKNQIDESNREQEVARVQHVERVKEHSKELADGEAVRKQSNDLKNNDTKALIEEKDIKKQAADELAALSHRDKVKDMTVVEKSTATANIEKDRSDKNERLLTQNELNIKTDYSQERALLEKQRSIEKEEKVKETSKALSTSTTSKEIEKENSIHDTKQSINKAAIADKTDKTIIPNSLGEKYPEGVSQEMYQKKDDAGILMAVITRRVVVIQGRGVEYVRTQTSHGVTYSKNGTPITEYTWQKETQDAKLQRHY